MFNFLKGRFKVLARDDSLDIVAYPGDTFELTYVNPIGGKETVLLTEKIEEKTIITSVVAFEFKNAFEMKRGIGGAFGEKDDIK